MKKRISITIDKQILDYLNFEVKKKTYANRSHAIEKIVSDKKNE